MNRKKSSSKHTRYINIILYFNMNKHKIKSGVMKLLLFYWAKEISTTTNVILKHHN